MGDWQIVYCKDCMAKVGERIDINESTAISCPYRELNGKCKYD